MEAPRRPAAAVIRRLHDEPDQTGQQSQSCSQEEAEGGRGGQGRGRPAAGGHTVEWEQCQGGASRFGDKLCSSIKSPSVNGEKYLKNTPQVIKPTIGTKIPQVTDDLLYILEVKLTLNSLELCV